MDKQIVISVAKQFSRFPAGRFRRDGEFSGEAFREKVLLPAFRGATKVVVELDGTAGYGSSFLEEAFGGLVRSGVIAKERIRANLELKTSDESLREEITEYVEAAVGRK